MQPGEFLSVPEHTGLILCSDGVPLFKSSKQALWPILLAVTSLPPGIRMNRDNIILAGVWQGPVKPPMDKILLPVLEKLEELKQHGIEVATPNGTKTVKTCLLMGVFDLIAKAMATNFVQFNGYYGCTYCFDKGVHISRRHLYYPSERHQPRTMRHVKRCVRAAEADGQARYGVKGRSVLIDHINVIQAVPVDYMHAVLEGVTKRLLECWLNTKLNAHRFYLGLSTDRIDKKLLRIKPPQEFRRTPRSISTYKHWKASEFRAWLLYYCLPVLTDILPSDYIFHLSLLVSAMHLLLGDCLQEEDISRASRLLEMFYTLIPELYPHEMLAYNIHCLIHLCQCVQNWGPLWGYSCFGFENMNGHLRKNIHGTRNTLPQLVHTIRMQQKLPASSKRLRASENSETIDLLDSLTATTSVETVIDQHTEVKGRIKHQKIDRTSTNAIESAGLHVATRSLPVCYKVRYKSIPYTAKAVEKKTARNGSICVFCDDIQVLHFGTIRFFFFCGSEVHALIDTFKESEDFCDHIRTPSIPELDSSLAKSINDFIFPVQKLSIAKETVAVPISHILSKCVHIPVKGSPFDYIVSIPNMFEHH